MLVLVLVLVQERRNPAPEPRTAVKHGSATGSKYLTQMPGITQHLVFCHAVEHERRLRARAPYLYAYVDPQWSCVPGRIADLDNT